MYQVIINNGTDKIIHQTMTKDAPKLTSGVVKTGINTIDSFSFSILPNNPFYNELLGLKTLVRVVNLKTGKVIFEGRVLIPTESMSDDGSHVKNVICESEMGYLMDSTQRWNEYRGTVEGLLGLMIDVHNRQTEPHKHFRIGRVEVSSGNQTNQIYRFLDYEKTFDSIKDKLIDRLGGELIIRKAGSVRFLDYVEISGEVKNTEIRISKNLESISKEQDPTEIITRLVPLGARLEDESDDETPGAVSTPRTTIESVNNGQDYIDDVEAIRELGIIEDNQTWDDITAPENLLSSAKKFLEENNRVRISYTLKALDLSLIGLDLESFEVGNWYKVINPVMGINESIRVIDKSVDILSPQHSNLSIGDKTLSIYDHQTNIKQLQERFADLEGATTNQNRKITSVAQTTTTIRRDVDALQATVDEADFSGLIELREEVALLTTNLTEHITHFEDVQQQQQQFNQDILARLDLLEKEE